MAREIRFFMPVAGTLFLLASMGWAQSPSLGAGPGSAAAGAKLNSSDKQFLTKAAEGGKSEVELGQLAEQKALSQDVKDFGHRMVKDHTQANDNLKQVAQKEGVALPDKMDPESAALKQRLEKLSGAQFDKTYMDAMVKDHTKDVQEFKQEASSAKDPEVKNFAQQTLPTLEEHLKLAKQIDAQEK